MVELRYSPVCRSYLYDGVPDLDQPLCLALHGKHYICNKGHHVHISYYRKETLIESPETPKKGMIDPSYQETVEPEPNHAPASPNIFLFPRPPNK